MSLVAQTHTDWEAIVVDNGSPGRRPPPSLDPRVVWVSAPGNLGECGGRNLALTRARANFVCYLDDDDLLPPASLADRLAFLKARPACGMMYAEYRTLRREQGAWVEWSARGRGSPWQRKEYYDSLVARAGADPATASYFLRQFNFIRGGTPMIRREVLDAVGPFDERLETYGDYDMWLRIAARFPIAFLDSIAYVYRVHEGSTHLRAAEDGRELQDALRLCRKHGLRRSVQFRAHQRDLDRLWSRSARIAAGRRPERAIRTTPPIHHNARRLPA